MKYFSNLFLVAVVLQMASARQPFYNTKPFMHKPLRNLGEPLILTPLIETNQLQQARASAEVHLDAFHNVTSYSGFFNVDNKNNGNLFFWFFPSASNYTEDPVLLWLQGGPGVSSLMGLFTEHGPFDVKNGSVLLRDYSWHKNYSVLYIDQPVGTGFSFTEGPYVNNQTQVGEHLYSALTQFFTVFSELQDNPFFISGESYAGKYVPAISYTIHQRNPTASLKINLQGVIIGNGLSDPRYQFQYGDMLYQLGLIDRSTLKTFNSLENFTISKIEEENFVQASSTWSEMVDTLFYKTTGLGNIYNFIKDRDDSPIEWQTFIVQDQVRQALHVGSQLYDYQSDKVYSGLFADITRSVAPWIVELLSNYRVLIFNGQLDIIVGYVLTENYLEHLNFSAATEYKSAMRNIWTVGNRVAGYVKTAGNLTEVLVRDAGHMVPADQPEFANDLLSKFIHNRRIA